MKLSSKAIEGFTSAYLLKKYNIPVAIPEFHRKMWDLCTSDSKRVAICAPRNHAKSTAITHAFLLASVLFRNARYVLIVSDTETQASNFLMDIKAELLENQDLMDHFAIKRFIKDSVTDIMVEMYDGWKFRITAQGAEQKVRGKKWGNQRPDLVICDDLENDEMVESQERREKLRNWFFKALVPSLADDGRVIVVGTILHLDALLYRLLKNKSWDNLFFKAHEAFDDFSNLLWPEKWSVERLRAERDEKINEGMPEVYSQEYLNNPLDQSEAYFRREDMVGMEEENYTAQKMYYAGVDFAISDSDKAAYTVIVVGGITPKNILCIEHVMRFRGDADDIIQGMISLQTRYDMTMWKAEEGQISKAIGPALNRAMTEKGVYLAIDPGVPGRDKRARARSIQARMRAGAVRFNKRAPWYPSFEEELLQFPKGAYKDQVDALAWLGLIIDKVGAGSSREEIEEEDYERARSFSIQSGRNLTTGY
jgi:predicted phage terminase large subunit-like protein